MAGGSKRRFRDGIEARQHLRRVLLGTDAHHVCSRRHELVCNGIDHLAGHHRKSSAYQEPPDLQECRNTIHGMGTVAIAAAIDLQLFGGCFCRGEHMQPVSLNSHFNNRWETRSQLTATGLCLRLANDAPTPALITEP